MNDYINDEDKSFNIKSFFNEIDKDYIPFIDEKSIFTLFNYKNEKRENLQKKENF